MHRFGTAALRDVDLDARTLAVALGDVAAVVAVLVVGLLRHGTNPLASPDHAVLVIGPFLLGWVVAAPLVGAYASETLATRRSLVWAGAIAWLVAALVGLDLRATVWFPGNVVGLFGIVVTGFGLLGVVAWRVAFSYLWPPGR